jgi:transcriptional regulator with XRE-family HTH domain
VRCILGRTWTIYLQRRVKYHAATVAFRVLRLVAVASILAFALTARTATATQAFSDDPAADAPGAVADVSPTDLGDEPLTDPPATEPPPTADPTPVATDPAPASDPVEPAPTESPAPDPSVTIGGATVSDPPAADQVPTESPPTDPLPSDPPASAEPMPAATDEPPPSEPPVPVSTEPPIPDASPAIDNSVVPEPPAVEPILPIPSELPSPPSVESHSGQSATSATPVALHATPRPVVAEPVEPAVVAPAGRPAVEPRSFAPGEVPHGTGLTLPRELEPVAAGLVAGLAVTNRAPASVAIAIEFGRAGSGWAGAIVFNLWLRRQLRERRMSQRQLAALSGVDHSTISRLLLHDRRPSLATATKLAGALRHVEGEPATADYFERIPEETLFPARRVEMALRGDDLLDDEEVRRLMSMYLEARRRRLARASSGGLASNGTTSAMARSSPTTAAPTRAGPPRTVPDSRR